MKGLNLFCVLLVRSSTLLELFQRKISKHAPMTKTKSVNEKAELGCENRSKVNNPCSAVTHHVQ